MRRTFTILLGAALLALTAGVALAADVTGKWTGEMNGPDGNSMTLTFNFKQDGAKLTGTVEGPGGQALEVKDGKVDGDKISFVISLDGGGGEMKILHEGTISGDEITLNVKMEGGPGDGPGGSLKLKRAN
jgi:autotransporter translocation and assembly factor TamB